jgi:serine/threonine protein kinase
MPEKLTGKIIADKYRIDSFLLDGEPGDLYRGRHLFMDKPVTLKVLPPALSIDDSIRERFASQARNIALFAHPNVLDVSDFGSASDGYVYAVFEGVHGETLKQAMAARGRFTVRDAVSIAVQIASALAAAHEKGFVHAGLTPDTVLVTGSNDVKVFDFAADGESARRRIASRSAVNVAYFAPEQFSGISDPDSRSDIYSLGVILFQMLAGEAPFTGETPTDVMLKHVEQPPPSIKEIREDVPGELDQVLKQALAKDPNERHQTAAEFAEAIYGASLSAGRGRSLWVTAAVAAVGILALGSVLIWATWSRQAIPTTQLQPDANGQPVQPIGPATGMEEQSLAVMPGGVYMEGANANIAQPPPTLSGGDGYNPWATGAPPAGAPTFVPPGGGSVSADPNSGSPFMPNLDLVCKDVATGEVVPCPSFQGGKPTARPSPTPPANSNRQADPSPRPTPELKGTPVREPTPAAQAPANRKGEGPGAREDQERNISEGLPRSLEYRK